MTAQIVHISARVVQPVLLNIPLELWERLLAMTPDGFSVQDTAIVALTDFVEQEAVNTAGKV
jgi:hypothetical protein